MASGVGNIRLGCGGGKGRNFKGLAAVAPCDVRL